MIISEKQLKKLISEEVQKAMSGYLNVPDYDVEKSVNRLVTIINTEADAFDKKYDETAAAAYDAYTTRLYSLAENLERFLKQLKQDGPFGF